MWRESPREEEQVVERRVCGSCQYFQGGGEILLGICTHPDHQIGGVTPLVRAAELRCRHGFGYDDWSPLIGRNPQTGVDILISERPAPFNRLLRALEPLQATDPTYESPAE